MNLLMQPKGHPTGNTSQIPLWSMVVSIFSVPIILFLFFFRLTEFNIPFQLCYQEKR